LIESNIDWGQDLLFLKQWVDRHPEVRPLGLAYYGGMDPHLVGLEYEVPPYGPDDPHTPGPSPPKGEGGIVGPRPGWYAISVNFVCGANFESYDEKGKGISFPPGAFHYFQRFEPVAKARYSIFIYHITDEDANRVRAELGLPPLPEGGKE